MTPKQKKILYVTLFAIFAVSVTAAVIAGVVQHEEDGFAHPGRSWDHAPLTVACRGYVPTEDEACETAQSVVATINTRLGFPMLQWNDSPGSEDIDIAMRAPIEVGGDHRDSAGGHFELSGSGDTYTHCNIWTMNVSGPDDLEWLVLYHELGHCLGLDHDDYGLSIMHPAQQRTRDGGIPPWFSDWDRRLLRERYR